MNGKAVEDFAPPLPGVDAKLGAMLRFHRRQAGISQLDLALELGVSTRHLSYVENDKARPSETMLNAIVETLGIPAVERNALFLAAGFRPRTLDGAPRQIDRPEVCEPLAAVLDGNDTAPVIVKDRAWNIVAANAVAEALFAALTGRDLVVRDDPVNAVDLVFAPHLLRPFVVNWDTVARDLVSRIRHEVGFAADVPEFRAIVAAAARYDGFVEHWRAAPPPGAGTLYRLRHGGDILDFRAVLTSFGAPYEVATRGIRIETFYPQDEATARFLARLAPAASTR